MTAKKQTVSYLRERFREVGFSPYARHGQNFLIDLNLLDLIARTAEIQNEDVVLEIGTGTGSLSVRLAEQAAHLITVEIDPHLADIALEQIEDCGNITLLQQDALRNKNNFDARVLETVAKRLEEHPNGQFKLVANLPYSVATPVISNLLLSQIPPSTLVVTIQKELAHRIVARPGTKDYGSLSVWVQSQCDTELVRELGPTVFWPRPKVSSAIVKMVLDPQRREALGDLAWFQTFVRTLFLHRRKFLRGALVGGFKQLSKPDVDQVMGAMSLPADARAEQLSLKQIQDLSRRIGEQIAHVGSAVRSPTAD